MNKGNYQNGSVILLLMIVGFLLVFTAMSTFTSSNFSIRKVSQRKSSVSAFNIAEAGKEHAIARINSDPRLPSPLRCDTILRNVGLDKGSYTVSCSTNVLKDSLWLRSVGSIKSNSTTIAVTCIPKLIPLNINPSINAAVMVRSSITVSGNTEIDGRNWCHIGDTVIDGGISGICYNGTLTQTGNSTIGGQGVAPMKKASPPIIDPNGLSNPTTPEEALGLLPGDLEFYIIDSIPSGPMDFENRIVYISPRAGDEIFLEPDFGGSSGIFIFHNESRTATLKNIKGYFNGIIIADRLDHINDSTRIYGAVITLSSTEGGNAFGNGDSDIRFSRKVLQLVDQLVQIGKLERIRVVAWKQE
ncbi:MAG: hypothetical protein PVI26_05535 [Chitinispirillia bacterium]